MFQDGLSPDELGLFLRQFALIPARYSEAFASGESDLAAVDFVPFFTMMFLHGGWLHLILNMWTLWLCQLWPRSDAKPLRKSSKRQGR